MSKFVHVLAASPACDFCDEEAATLNIGAPDSGGVAVCTECAKKLDKELTRMLEAL
jgi:transcription elongation factor Elf1